MQRLEQEGELVEQHSDTFRHALARQQHGVTKASIAAVVAEGKIPLLLTDVEGAQRAKANGTDCLTVFLAPANPEVCELCRLNVLIDQNKVFRLLLQLLAAAECICEIFAYQSVCRA